ARKALIVDLAEGDNRGKAIGAYYSFLGAIVFPASLLGDWLWEAAPAAPFVLGGAVTGLGLVPLLLVRPKRKREEPDGMCS
ncbi:MAG: hypothetical protein ACE5O2_12585, partial [Armatimonadota bacterium]